MTLTEFSYKTKSKSSIVTRDTPYLTTDTFLDVVVDKDISITVSGIILLLWMTMYLLLAG